MEPLDQNFADFLKSLNANHVEYLVVGGYAVGYHGFVRATGDLDVFVGCPGPMPNNCWPSSTILASTFPN
jgi:hypothetical protein